MTTSFDMAGCPKRAAAGSLLVGPPAAAGAPLLFSTEEATCKHGPYKKGIFSRRLPEQGSANLKKNLCSRWACPAGAKNSTPAAPVFVRRDELRRGKQGGRELRDMFLHYSAGGKLAAEFPGFLH